MNKYWKVELNRHYVFTIQYAGEVDELDDFIKREADTLLQEGMVDRVYDEEREEVIIMPHIEKPKRYNFPEAYAMMKAGKWMRPLEFSPHNHGAICREHGVIAWRYDSGYTRVEEEISLSLLDSQWEEVQP